MACSASLCLIAPYLAMGLPNCCRSVAYATEAVEVRLQPPNAAAANFILPMLRMLTAILKPFCRSLKRFSTGTLQSLKNTWQVELPLIPILCSSGFTVIPGKDFSTMNALRFSSSSIFANTINISAKPALVIHIFCPLMR